MNTSSSPIEPRKADLEVPSTLTVVGSLNVDLTCRVHRLPSPGETIGGGTLTRQPGGKGGNQASAAARLAGAARMVGAVGADPDGRLLTEALDRAGVDISAVEQVSAPTGTALVVIDSEGENQIAVAPGANAVVSLDRADISDGGPVLAQLEIAVDTVLEAARRTTGFFALNAAPAQALPAELLERCDLVIVNESEYELIPELRSAERVAVTYGAGGASMYTQGVRTAHASAAKTSVVNSVGAGDAFCAALVLALASGLDEESSLAAACAVGAAAVASELSQPEFERLEHYLAI